MGDSPHEPAASGLRILLLEDSDIDAELRRQGVRPGDTVRIAGIELEWEPQPWELA